MTFHFFAPDGGFRFNRPDAIEFRHFCDTFSCEGLFPLRADRPVEAGMLVGWRYGGAWEIHEILETETDGAGGGTVRLLGRHIAVSLLKSRVIDTLEETDCSAYRLLSLLLPGSGVGYGGIADIRETDTAAVSTSDGSRARLRASASSSASTIAYVNNGALVTVLSREDPDWTRVRTSDGKQGYISADLLRTVIESLSAEGRPRDDLTAAKPRLTATLSERFSSAWDILNRFTSLTCYHIEPAAAADENGFASASVSLMKEGREDGAVRLTVSSNVSGALIKRDHSELLTRLIPLGANGLTIAGLTRSRSNGDAMDKPSGQVYLENPAASAPQPLPGGIPRAAVVKYTDVKDAKELLTRAWNELTGARSVPGITIECDAADLYAMGLGGSPLSLHGAVCLILPDTGLRAQAHITALTRDLLYPGRTRLTIGTKSGKDILLRVGESA